MDKFEKLIEKLRDYNKICDYLSDIDKFNNFVKQLDANDIEDLIHYFYYRL